MNYYDYVHETETITEMLSDAITDIFLERQKVHGITSGDLEPVLFAMLDEKTEQLAKAIAESIHFQTIWCKP